MLGAQSALVINYKRKKRRVHRTILVRRYVFTGVSVYYVDDGQLIPQIGLPRSDSDVQEVHASSALRATPVLGAI
jgi:hypothetical protein